jgi:hypothetical protein
MKKGVKPFSILLFLFATFIILAFISLVFPPGGIRMGRNFYLNFPSPDKIFYPDNPDYADITSLLDGYSKTADTLPAGDNEEIPGLSVEISNEITEEISLSDDIASPEAADEGKMRQLIFPLQFPAGNDSVLYPFFRELEKTETHGNFLRILHYGDSQIENSRITSTLRNQFQMRFGGSGVGLIPVLSPVPHNASFDVIAEGNWERYTILARGKRNTMHNRYGLLMSYSSLAPVPGTGVNGSFTIRPTGVGHARARRMEALGLYMGHNNKPFLLELSSGGKMIDAELFFPSDSPRWIRWTLPGPAAGYTLSFEGDAGPEIYSISIDGAAGVAVDNIPMRGSSGLEFTATDLPVMKRMMEDLNVRLIILQFGVNVVPNVVNDYSYYENALFRQLMHLKSISQRYCIIVVGVSDMSARMPGGHYQSYPNIELIRDAQRNAAFRAGVPFWDLYSAMGGRNSMPSWVMADPPLGQPDYTHFTFRGSALVGDLLYNAITIEYDDFLRKEHPGKSDIADSKGFP